MTEETQIIAKPTDENATASGGDGSHIGTLSLRGIIASLVFGTVCAMAIMERGVTEPLYSISLVIMGFYYGQKTK